MLQDQHRFRQRWSAVVRPGRGQALAERIEDGLAADIQRSIARREQRQGNLPKPTYPDDLPIAQRRAEIARAIEQHQIIIVCGETGSGKTTQLPKICVELGRGVAGLIGHTQPRRIAARTIAARIASELQSPIGHAVGYKVRFTDRLSRDTYIKVMTDGILLAETQQDRYFTHYDTLIIDEAHERSLNIDFLLGYIKQLLPKRPDLKVIVTSATIDPQRFSAHFGGAPIIEVSGRTYPVDVRYRPVQAEEPDEEDPTVLEAILRAVDEIDGSGDVLVFLSGEREIRETTEALRKHHPPRTEILPLYARLSVEEQNRVFQPHALGVERRIVLATNVAETSLTVPGIRYVIDPGFARISRYSANARVQRLPIERVSRASADQRKGRCGRLGPGICIRLFSEEDFRERDAFTDPEILRANLASVILQMKALKLGDIERFAFIDPPRPAMIREGYQTLLELGAVNDKGRITNLGLEIARLPVDPRIGRMILAAREEKCLKEILIIAAALATQEPRLRPMDQAQAADLAHLQFVDESSDFLSYLKLWEFYRENARHLSTSKLRKLCQQHFLSYMRLREWHDVHQQLHALVTESGMKLNDQPASTPNIHRALLSGLLNNVGSKGDAHEYLGPRERKFNIFPGSGLFKKSPKWLMAAELVETTRLYARTVARIHPEWIERVGSHLLKHTHSDPHWNEASAHVEAFERVSLHGLVIVPKRRIHYGTIQPQVSREIFIKQGLVEGAMPAPMNQAPFLMHNRALMNQLRIREAKQRRRNVMVTEDAVFDFYDRRVPAGVYNGPLFEKWRKQVERERPEFLFMSREDLERSDAPAISADEFPDAISLSGVRVPLGYHLDPGGPRDGVTATVPLEAVNQIDERAAQWLVPGMLTEKITELIRTLPKSLRREFVPAPEHAQYCASVLHFGSGDLLEELGRTLHRRVGTQVPRDAWRPELLPDYLRMNFEVIDVEGRVIACGRELTEVKRALANIPLRPLQHIPAGVVPGLETLRTAREARGEAQALLLPDQQPISNLTAWTFGDLPRRLESRRGAFTVVSYPALIDDGHSVSLGVLDSEHAADQAHRAGLRRLFWLQVRDELAVHVDYLPTIEDLCLLFSPLGDGDELKRDLMDAIVDRVYLGDSQDVYTQTEFERRLRSGWDKLWAMTSEISDLANKILSVHQAVELQMDGAEHPLWQGAVTDIRDQLSRLFIPRFLVNTPYRWLQQFPRYGHAIQTRMRKLIGGNAARDQRCAEELAALWTRYATQAERNRIHSVHDPELELYRWMIEEYRVSLFAQELGTLMPVSSKRLEAQWSRVRTG